jgi:hypothetical protein
LFGKEIPQGKVPAEFVGAQEPAEFACVGIESQDTVKVPFPHIPAGKADSLFGNKGTPADLAALLRLPLPACFAANFRKAGLTEAVPGFLRVNERCSAKRAAAGEKIFPQKEDDPPNIHVRINGAALRGALINQEEIFYHEQHEQKMRFRIGTIEAKVRGVWVRGYLFNPAF